MSQPEFKSRLDLDCWICPTQYGIVAKSSGGGGAPPAVDPVALANAQMSANIGTATAQSKLNNVNTTSPLGTTGFSFDPDTGRWTLNQAPNAQTQAIIDPQLQAAATQAQAFSPAVGQAQQFGGAGTSLLAQLLQAIPTNQGNTLQAGPIQSSLGSVGPYQTSVADVNPVQSSLDLSTPGHALSSAFGSPSQNVQYGIGGQAPIQSALDLSTPGHPLSSSIATPSQDIQYGFGSGSPIQGQVSNGSPIQNRVGFQDEVNTNFGDLSRQAQDAAYRTQAQYLDPQFKQQQADLEQRLADQGIGVNTDAYSRATGDFARARQGAYQSAQDAAVAAGNAEQNQLFGQSLAAGQFGNQARLAGGQFTNAAQQQGQQQLLQQGQFANTAQQQRFAEDTARAQLANQAQQQQFGQSAQQTQVANAAQLQAAQEAAQQGAFANAAQQQGFGQGLNLATLANQAQQQEFGQLAQGGAFANAAQLQAAQEAAQQAQFGNQAQQQQYTQALGRGEFGNQGQLLAQQQLAQQGAFANAAQQQGFGQAQQQFQNPLAYLGALSGAANQNFGTSLSGISGLSPQFGWAGNLPTFGGSPTSVSPANVVGAQQIASQAAQNRFADANTLNNQMFNGLGSLGSSLFGGGSSGGTGGLLGGLFGSSGLLGGLFSGGATDIAGEAGMESLLSAMAFI